MLVDIFASNFLLFEKAADYTNGNNIHMKIITIISILTDTSKSSEAVYLKYVLVLVRKCEDQWEVSIRDLLLMTVVPVLEE